MILDRLHSAFKFIKDSHFHLFYRIEKLKIKAFDDGMKCFWVYSVLNGFWRIDMVDRA